MIYFFTRILVVKRVFIARAVYFIHRPPVFSILGEAGFERMRSFVNRQIHLFDYLSKPLANSRAERKEAELSEMPFSALRERAEADGISGETLLDAMIAAPNDEAKKDAVIALILGPGRQARSKSFEEQTRLARNLLQLYLCDPNGAQFQNDFNKALQRLLAGPSRAKPAPWFS